MDYQHWESASEGKRLDSIKITITKQYFNPKDNQTYDHNISYDVPTHGHEMLGEVEFSTLKHDVEDTVKRLRYKFEARHRRTINNLNSNVRYL